MPYLWGTTGIGVNTRFVKEEIDSWEALWDPKYRGRIAMLNDPREVFAVALKLLGYSANTRDLRRCKKPGTFSLNKSPWS